MGTHTYTSLLSWLYDKILISNQDFVEIKAVIHLPYPPVARITGACHHTYILDAMVHRFLNQKSYF